MSKKMSKKKTRRKQPALKEVGFNFGAGEERMAKISVPGYAGFSITYKVPGAEWQMNIALEQDGSTTEGARESRGKRMISYIAAHLVRWSLKAKPDEASVAALKDIEVLMALWDEIHGSARKAKN